MLKRDIDSVYAIECESFRTPWSRKSLLDELKNNLAYYGVLHDEDKVIGYAGMWVLYDEAHITNVAIKKSERGKGLGRFLMQHMMNTAANKGASRMTLEVREHNTVAQNLYKSLGFVTEGVRKKYYSDTGEDGYIMWADIGAAVSNLSQAERK